jgi:hypothetical protein
MTQLAEYDHTISAPTLMRRPTLIPPAKIAVIPGKSPAENGINGLMN